MAIQNVSGEVVDLLNNIRMHVNTGLRLPNVHLLGLAVMGGEMLKNDLVKGFQAIEDTPSAHRQGGTAVPREAGVHPDTKVGEAAVGASPVAHVGIVAVRKIKARAQSKVDLQLIGALP